MNKTTHTVYVDLVGSSLRDFNDNPAEHVAYLEGTVTGLLRGMGLARRSVYQATAGHWPGSASTSGADEYNTIRRIAVNYELMSQAHIDAKTLSEFLLANAWGTNLLAVFVTVTQGSTEDIYPVHGEARSFLELTCYDPMGKA